MNMKCLMTTSVIALTSACAAQAADVIAPSHEVAPVVSAPEFSWTGFYLGVQAGGFFSKPEMNVLENNSNLFSKDATAQPSGFMAGIYAGSNINIGNGLILGIETDASWADKVDIRLAPVVSFVEKKSDATEPSDPIVYESGLKEKWSGATRVRLGFETSHHHLLPYISGGVSYASLEALYGVGKPQNKPENTSGYALADGFDGKKTMIGYTLGAGVDFAMTHNVVLRAEYRYADFGKKKFADDKYEVNYKTNDFRVGVAYKF
ncbi:outer membrane protein [Bartonella sp. B12(2025)]